MVRVKIKLLLKLFVWHENMVNLSLDTNILCTNVKFYYIIQFYFIFNKKI